MRTTLAALALLAFAALPAGAQNATATRNFGDWELACKVDGMTDQASCTLSAWAKGPAGVPPMLIWEDEFPRVKVFGGANKLLNAWLRIGRNAPIFLGTCTPQNAVCQPLPADLQKTVEQLESGAETALLRIGGLEAGLDFVFDLKGFIPARTELRRLTAALPAPAPTDPARERRAAVLAAYRAAEQRCENLPRGQILACKSAWADCVKTDPATEAALETCLAKTRHDAKGIAARTAAR